MQQRAYVAVAVGLLCTMLWSATVQAAPSVYPTGVTRYDPGKAYNVFILFSGADDKTHLIDMDGNEVHRWDHRGFPSDMLDPALVGGARGHVMVQLADMTGSETGMIPGLPACLRTRPSVSSIGMARSCGNGARPRRAERRSSTTIGLAFPTATRWSCLS